MTTFFLVTINKISNNCFTNTLKKISNLKNIYKVTNIFILTRFILFKIVF